MRLCSRLSILSLLLGLVACAPASQDASAAYGAPSNQYTISSFTIPTRYESTVLGRRLVNRARLGSISTIFPHHLRSDRIPANVHDTPIALPEYIASCEEPSGEPTILALTVSTITQNALAGSNVSLSVSWWDEYEKISGKKPWSYASLPRLSLIGQLEQIAKEDVERHNIVECFTSAHADSKWWLPGDKASPHEGVWMRLVVKEIYWIGGFGDRAFIGWFDPKEWRNVTVDEFSKARLPGEE